MYVEVGGIAFVAFVIEVVSKIELFIKATLTLLTLRESNCFGTTQYHGDSNKTKHLCDIHKDHLYFVPNTSSILTKA